MNRYNTRGKTTENDSDDTSTLNIIEMGAGRGMLGLVVAGAAAAAASANSKVRLFLVDRSGSRAKAETTIRTAAKDDNSIAATNETDCLKLDSVEVRRIKADLAHVHMPTALPFLSNKQQSTQTIVIAKHLCGSGTDLAFKSLSDVAPNSIDGCVMATCCHGLCDWNDYTGRETLLKLFCGVGGLTTFGKRDFDALKRWTSASVLDDRNGSSCEDGEKHYTEYTDNDEDKSDHLNVFTVVQELGLACGGNGLGRACQRIIDYGRCQYLTKLLCTGGVSDEATCKSLKVKLCHYVPRTVTPQNALIMMFTR
jgi:tRNA:m4X modification enzyme